MNEVTGTACPVCEYERGEPGKPIARNNEMHCLSCGSSWKQFTNSLSSVKSSKDEQKLGRDNYIDVTEEPDVSVSRFSNSSNRTASYAILAGMAALVLCIGATMAFLGSGVTEKKGLHVADIRFEELVRNGGKVVRVNGTIENSSSNAEVVPRVALVLRKTNGSELTRWYYNSPVAKLHPGARTRFVSSIPYDTPFIASVEALFE